MTTKTLTFKKSSKCGDSACVEIAIDGDVVYIRDVRGVVIEMSIEDFRGLRSDLYDGEFEV